MKSTHWCGIATPEALDKCLTFVFDFTRRSADWLADFGKACTRSWANRYDGLARSVAEAQRSYEDHKARLSGGAQAHPADVCTSMLKSVIREASDGSLTEDEFLASWCFANFAKKFRFGCMMSDAEAKAGFIERNARCANHLRWDVRARMRELLKDALPPVNTEEGRFGPGATLERANTWPDKVKYMAWLRGQTHLFAWDAEALEVAPRFAKLHAVPKDFHRKRLITVEPLVVAWHQQAARSTILNSVHRGSLRGTIMDQSISDAIEVGHVALHGTRVKDPVLRQRDRCIRGAQKGDTVTLDLSDASDTISKEAVFDVFPGWCLALLEKCRSPTIRDSGITTDLRIYAGMGNATTFIVETLFFWALFTAVGELSHCGKPQVTVFGDDIVMNGKVARNQWFQDMIRESGILINWEKSGLSAGPGFREACGAVCYRDCYVPFTPRFYGYAGTKEGAIGYCELCSRLLNSSLPLFKLFGLGLLAYPGKPDAPLLFVRSADEVGSVMAYVVEEGLPISRIPGMGVLFATCYPRREESVRWRFNPNLHRIEAFLYASRAKTASLTLRDPVWGPGVSRSWGWWAYKLALLGQATQDVVVSRKSREIRYAIAHRTSVRRRWVPVGFLNRFG